MQPVTAASLAAGRPAAPRRSGRLLALVVDLLELGVDHALAVAARSTAGAGPPAAAAPSAPAGRVYIASPSFIEAWASASVLALMSLGVLAVQHALEVGHAPARSPPSPWRPPCRRAPGGSSRWRRSGCRRGSWPRSPRAASCPPRRAPAASFTIFSMSASLRPPDAWMRIACSLPVALSLAWTLTMPFASMSKVTSICGTPRGAGGMPTRSNWPSSLLCAASSRSPWKTRIVTADWLSVGGGEDLALLGRDGGVAVDDPGEHAAQGLDAERERGDVEQQDVLDLARQHRGLDRRADGHDLVGVHALVRLLAEELLHGLDDLRHAGHAADQDDLVDLRRP